MSNPTKLQPFIRNSFKEKIIVNKSFNSDFDILDIFIPFILDESEYVYITFRHQDFDLISEFKWDEYITCFKINNILKAEINDFNERLSFDYSEQISKSYIYDYLYKRLITQGQIGLIPYTSIQQYLYFNNTNNFPSQYPINSVEYFNYFHNLSIDKITSVMLKYI